MNDDIFKYRGRLPVRSDGKARREAILEATLQLIINEGIRGVRHRAVAEKAEVPLAATTYYFNDIFDLIHDAFIYFSEKAVADVHNFEQQTFGILQQLEESTSNPQELLKSISEFTHRYVMLQASQTDFRILEQTFRTQALRDNRVAEMVKVVEKRQLETISMFLEKLNLDKLPSRARIVFNMLNRLEYELTLNIITEKEAETIIFNTLSLALSN